jgi:hypothetical protein
MLDVDVSYVLAFLGMDTALYVGPAHASCLCIVRWTGAANLAQLGMHPCST